MAELDEMPRFVGPVALLYAGDPAAAGAVPRLFLGIGFDPMNGTLLRVATPQDLAAVQTELANAEQREADRKKAADARAAQEAKAAAAAATTVAAASASGGTVDTGSPAIDTATELKRPQELRQIVRVRVYESACSCDDDACDED